MTQESIIRKAAMDAGLTITETRRIYAAYWRVIREHVEKLPLKEDLTDDEFAALQPNVNIPSLGKLYVTPDRYRRVKNIYKEHLENNKQA